MEKTSDNPDIEDETHDLPVGVGIKDLRKVFKVRIKVNQSLPHGNFTKLSLIYFQMFSHTLFQHSLMIIVHVFIEILQETR